MKVAIIGYGKMGKTIEQLIEKDTRYEVVLKISSKNLNDFTLENLQKADVAIEFSNPKSVINNIETCFEAKVPIIVGTTGWNEHLETITKKCEEQNTALLYASNFSIGVNLFMKVNQYLAKLMHNFPDYNIKMEETHHTEKKDAPSGTAITLANQLIKANKNYTAWQLNKSNQNDEIEIKAHRIKDNKGEHKIIYENNIDQIEISHKAKNRNGFALGAINAAKWIIGKNGIYNFAAIFDEM